MVDLVEFTCVCYRSRAPNRRAVRKGDGRCAGAWLSDTDNDLRLVHDQRLYEMVRDWSLGVQLDLSLVCSLARVTVSSVSSDIHNKPRNTREMTSLKTPVSHAIRDTRAV